MEDIKKRRETSGEWCLPMCSPFPSEFCAAVLVPRREREQCLSEINTTQRERGQGEAGGRGAGKWEDRADKHTSDIQKEGV